MSFFPILEVLMESAKFQSSAFLNLAKMTFLDRLNLPKCDFTQNRRGGKIIKFQKSQALTSQFLEHSVLQTPKKKLCFTKNCNFKFCLTVLSVCETPKINGNGKAFCHLDIAKIIVYPKISDFSKFKWQFDSHQ